MPKENNNRHDETNIFAVCINEIDEKIREEKRNSKSSEIVSKLEDFKRQIERQERNYDKEDSEYKLEMIMKAFRKTLGEHEAKKKTQAQPQVTVTAEEPKDSKNASLLIAEIDNEIAKLQKEIKGSKNPPDYKAARVTVLNALKTYVLSNPREEPPQRNLLNPIIQSNQEHLNTTMEKLSGGSKVEHILTKACEFKGVLFDAKEKLVRPKNPKLEQKVGQQNQQKLRH